MINRSWTGRKGGAQQGIAFFFRESRLRKLGCLGETFGLVPDFRRQWKQPPCSSGFVASIIVNAILPGCRKIAADRSPLRIYAAVHLFADKTHEGKAAWFGPVAPFHNQPEVVELISHFDWYASWLYQVRFSPIEGGPVISAAGTARKTRIYRHIFYDFKRLWPKCSRFS